MSDSTGVSTKLLYSVAIGLGVIVIGGGAACWYQQYKKKFTIPKKWRRIGTLNKINIFPIKSCAPLNLKADDEVICDVLSMSYSGCHDRSLMVIDDNNEMLTGRTFPKMLLIGTKIVGPAMVAFSAPGMEDIVLDFERLETADAEIATAVWSTKMNVVLCGKVFDNWFSRCLLQKEEGLRLVHYTLNKPIRAINSRLVKEPFITPDDRGTFGDATSFMLMNLASIDDLNTRLSSNVDPLQFRGNFHLKMDNDEPYAEDKWQWIKIGDDVIFRVVAPCTRCIFPNINVVTAERDPNGEPLKTLRSYRQFQHYASPALGIHLGLRHPGVIKTNDIIYIDDEDDMLE